MTLAACGGGGGGGGGSNVAPTASFTATPSTGQAPLLVNFDASASHDTDGSIASYGWNFGDGSTGSGVTASHTYTSAADVTVTLTVTDNGGKTARTTQTVSVTAGPPPTSVVVSGKVTFDRVPFGSTGSGLNYGATRKDPARGIVVQLIKSDQTVLFSTSTDDNGNYSFDTAPVNTSVFVRARAELLATGTVAKPATWHVQVKNNTNSNALYVLDSPTFSTGVANVTTNLWAKSGWPDLGGTTYSGTRAAAPFAILDSVYTAIQFLVTQGDSSIALPALDVFWSTANHSSDNWAPETGAIQTTLFRTGEGIYVLGTDGNDTDEYDEHVLVHEFHHYFADSLSRDDSVGGAHSLNEKLDLRVAFSEGMANAFSGMALNDPVYRDSYGASQGTDFQINFETVAVGTSDKGWFSEGSIASLDYDLWDSAADAGDSATVPYSAILTVMRNQLRTGQAMTSIFPYVTALKAQVPAQASAINSLVTNQNMVAGTMDAFGSTETNDGGQTQDVLPIYTDISLGGQKTVCTTAAVGVFNKIGDRRFLKFTLNAAQSVTIIAQYTSTGSTAPLTPSADPDFAIYHGGLLAVSESSTVNTESKTMSLAAGDYVLEVYDYSHVDTSAGASQRGRTCMVVSLN